MSSGDALQYLERFLNSIKSLPAEVGSKFRQVRELDIKCAEQMAAIEAASQQHCAAISAKQRLKQQNPRGRKGKGAGAASPSHANTPASPTPSPPLDGADGNGSGAKPAAAAAAAAAEEMDAAAAAAYDVEAVERTVAADQNEAVHLAEEKLRLTEAAYNAVDSVCRRLDVNMKKFEQQLRKASAVDVTAEPVDRRRGRKRDRSAEADDAHQLHRKLAAEMREEIEKASATAAAGAGAAAAAVADSSSSEPVYCTCKKVSFGEMVACDNPECPIEWFHFACVGLETTPKGKWFCDDCKSAKKQKVKK